MVVYVSISDSVVILTEIKYLKKYSRDMKTLAFLINLQQITVLKTYIPSKSILENK